MPDTLPQKQKFCYLTPCAFVFPTPVAPPTTTRSSTRRRHKIRPKTGNVDMADWLDRKFYIDLIAGCSQWRSDRPESVSLSVDRHLSIAAPRAPFLCRSPPCLFVFYLYHSPKRSRKLLPTPPLHAHPFSIFYPLHTKWPTSLTPLLLKPTRPSAVTLTLPHGKNSFGFLLLCCCSRSSFFFYSSFLFFEKRHF